MRSFSVTPFLTWAMGLNHFGEFLPQVWAIVMTMHGNGMLRCRFHKFFLGVCRDRNGAVHLAWVFAAIHKNSSHLNLPVISRWEGRLLFYFSIAYRAGATPP